jgi:hypothetical protein
MPETVTEITVFIASPGDVAKERRALDVVADEINRTVGSAEGFRLAVKKWETRARPAAGRPQGVINQQLGPSDIFVGVMWKRFGTPTGKAGSGTEEEFDEAYAQWKRKRKHKPEILFYFRESKFYPKTAAETRQFAAVQAFREKAQARALTWTYPSAARFPDVVRPHLVEAARAVMARTSGRKKHTRRAAPNPAGRATRGQKRPKKPAKPKHRLPKVRRRLTDADRSRYFSRGFTNVKRYFREGAQDINAHVRGAKASIQEAEDGSLFVEVTSGAQVLNRARIRQEDRTSWDRGIAFEQGPHLDLRYSSGWSEFARLEDADGELSFRLSHHAYGFGHDTQTHLKPKQVFDHFWSLFVEQLERES